MAIHYKVLGQAVPSANATWTQLYAVPTGKEAVCSSLTVAKQTLVYDTAAAGGVSQALQLSMTVSAGDIVEVYAASTSIAFNLFGSELDA